MRAHDGEEVRAVIMTDPVTIELGRGVLKMLRRTTYRDLRTENKGSHVGAELCLLVDSRSYAPNPPQKNPKTSCASIKNQQRCTNGTANPANHGLSNPEMHPNVCLLEDSVLSPVQPLANRQSCSFSCRREADKGCGRSGGLVKIARRLDSRNDNDDMACAVACSEWVPDTERGLQEKKIVA
jgi:hypothetical protein